MAKVQTIHRPLTKQEYEEGSEFYGTQNNAIQRAKDAAVQWPELRPENVRRRLEKEREEMKP